MGAWRPHDARRRSGCSAGEGRAVHAPPPSPPQGPPLTSSRNLTFTGSVPVSCSHASTALWGKGARGACKGFVGVSVLAYSFNHWTGWGALKSDYKPVGQRRARCIAFQRTASRH